MHYFQKNGFTMTSSETSVINGRVKKGFSVFVCRDFSRGQPIALSFHIARPLAMKHWHHELSFPFMWLSLHQEHRTTTQNRNQRLRCEGTESQWVCAVDFADQLGLPVTTIGPLSA